MTDQPFFDAVRQSLFHGSFNQGQVNGIDSLLATWRRYGDGDNRKLAYILATGYHETDKTMRPIEEYGKGKGHPYGAPAGPWHQIYDGRGVIQLTWEANYIRATTELRKLGIIDQTIDLDKTPALAMRPDIASAIAVVGMSNAWFTGKKLSDYITSHGADFVGARRIINGQDKAIVIAGYATQFLDGLNKIVVS